MFHQRKVRLVIAALLVVFGLVLSTVLSAGSIGTTYADPGKPKATPPGQVKKETGGSGDQTTTGTGEQHGNRTGQPSGDTTSAGTGDVVGQNNGQYNRGTANTPDPRKKDDGNLGCGNPWQVYAELHKDGSIKCVKKDHPSKPGLPPDGYTPPEGTVPFTPSNPPDGPDQPSDGSSVENPTGCTTTNCWVTFICDWVNGKVDIVSTTQTTVRDANGNVVTISSSTTTIGVYKRQ